MAANNNGNPFMPASECGRFLMGAVGGPLTRALAELVVQRPADPVNFLSEYLLDYQRRCKALSG